MKSTDKHSIFHFANNDSAVLDLPLYLVVTIIIGSIALASILSMIILPPYFTPNPVLTITPVVTAINSSNTTIQYEALVNTQEGKPIANAHVIIKNGQTISTNITNEFGIANLSIQAIIPPGLHECYFDVIVKSSTHQVSYQKMLKVVLWR
jgi:hypothetical protein